MHATANIIGIVIADIFAMDSAVCANPSSIFGYLVCDSEEELGL